MRHTQRRNAEQRMAWVTLIAAVVVALYWLTYCADATLLVGENQTIHAFESAFPLADAVLAALLLAASRCLFGHRCAGAVLLVAAGSVAIYLGLLDVTFYAGQGLYASRSGAALIELAVNGLCLGGGAVAVRLGWVWWRPA